MFKNDALFESWSAYVTDEGTLAEEPQPEAFDHSLLLSYLGIPEYGFNADLDRVITAFGGPSYKHQGVPCGVKFLSYKDQIIGYQLKVCSKCPYHLFLRQDFDLQMLLAEPWLQRIPGVNPLDVVSLSMPRFDPAKPMPGMADLLKFLNQQ